MVDFVKQTGEADYSEDVMRQDRAGGAGEGKGRQGRGRRPRRLTATSEDDELLPAAVEVVLETGQASVSMLQRRLKLGYSRAARLVDQMEERGIVGPFEGSKPRQLLIDQGASGRSCRWARPRRRSRRSTAHGTVRDVFESRDALD